MPQTAAEARREPASADAIVPLPARPAADVAPGGAHPEPGKILESLPGLRDSIFDRLVSGENDVVGLLAFSLSMQNKRDWLAAFRDETGRDPNPDELAAYDIGERIERRLATYRKLAEHALSGNSFWASATLTPVGEFPGAPAPLPPPKPVPEPTAPPAPARGFMGKQASGMFGAFLLLAGTVGGLAVAVLAYRHFAGV